MTKQGRPVTAHEVAWATYGDDPTSDDMLWMDAATLTGDDPGHVCLGCRWPLAGDAVQLAWNVGMHVGYFCPNCAGHVRCVLEGLAEAAEEQAATYRECLEARIEVTPAWWGEQPAASRAERLGA